MVDMYPFRNKPIVKCKGDDCEIKNHCYRFRKEDDELFQPFFYESPVELNGKECKFFLSRAIGIKNYIAK